MKRSNLKSGILGVFILFTLSFYSCSCSCYLEQTYANVATVRTKLIVLVDHATDSIKNYSTEIGVTGKIIDQAKEVNSSRKGCNQVGKIWNLLKNDSTGVYDRFLTDWKSHKILPAVYLNSVKTSANKILDQLVVSENAIKEKKKPCK